MLFIAFFLTTFFALADDPGITKVRLLQQNDSVYILEADIPRILLNTIQQPVFPERFRFTDFEYEDQSGWITLKLTVTTSGQSLSPEDEILLPWLRNAADFTARWEDGTTYKGLFNRTLNGIHIPLKEVMPAHKTTLEVIQESFFIGLNHLLFKGIHIVLIIVLVLAYPTSSTYRYLLWYSSGQAISLVLSELRIPGYDLLFSELIIIVFILSLAYSCVYKRDMRYTGPILLIVGVMHALAYINEISGMELQPVQRIQSLFVFNMVIDLGHFLLAAILLSILPKISRLKERTPRLAIISGGVSVFLILLVFQENIMTGNKKILAITSTQGTLQARVPLGSSPASAQVQRGTGLMTTPAMVYLSVEPYEIRQEILLYASEVVTVIDPDYHMNTIPVSVQEQIKSGIRDSLLGKNSMRINDLLVIPNDIRTQFVTLSRGGVSVREIPVEESLDNGIIGVTFIYDIESFPDSIIVDWFFFPGDVQSIETSVVDPHGAFTKILKRDDKSINWVSRIPGYRPASVEPVIIEKYELPAVTFLLWLTAFLLFVIYYFQKSLVARKGWIILLMAIGFVLYPFSRNAVSLPFMPKWIPTQERTGVILNDLLSNVYRAFDHRNEDDVYNRLAMSVTGDQLTEIYLQNRQAMALENRGGARANVDEIKILEVTDIHKSDNEAFTADALWTVRGSVNHFGHTHYRQNQYRALVSFVVDNETWKISYIEMIDESRIY